MSKPKCTYCGKEITWGNSHKRFCGPNCRKGWERRKDKFETGKRQAYESLIRMRDLSKRYPDMNPEIINLLKWMKGEINDLLLLARDTDTMDRHVMMNDFTRRHR